MTILIITLLGAALRLILAGQSLWLDEAASVVIASLPPKELLQALAGDFHPPLYYLLLKPWLSLAGNSEVLLRLPGILIGTLTIPATFLLTKTVFNPKGRAARFEIAHLAALLLSINPLHIYYSQELRMYSLSAFFATLSWYLLLKWLKNRQTKYLAYFIAITTLGFYTFYLSIFILASQWLYILVYHKKHLRSFAAGNAIFAILLLPWLPTLFKQMGGGSYLVKALPGWSALSGNLSWKSLVLVPAKFSLGRISMSPRNLYYLVTGLTLTFISLLFTLTLKVKQSRPFLFWLFTPLVLGVLVSFFTPVLGYWRYIFLLPAFSILLAIGVASLPKAIFVLNLSLLIVLFSFSNLYFISNPKFHRENWSSLANLIKSKKQETLILVNFTDAFAPLKFYLPQTKVFPTQDKLGHTRPDLDQELPPLIDKETVVIYVDYLSDITNPKREIMTWLHRAGLKETIQYQFAGLGTVYEYQAP